MDHNKWSLFTMGKNVLKLLQSQTYSPRDHNRCFRSQWLAPYGSVVVVGTGETCSLAHRGIILATTSCPFYVTWDQHFNIKWELYIAPAANLGGFWVVTPFVRCDSERASQSSHTLCKMQLSIKSWFNSTSYTLTIGHHVLMISDWYSPWISQLYMCHHV